MRVLEGEVDDEHRVGPRDEHRVGVRGIRDGWRPEGRPAHRHRHRDEVAGPDDVDDDVVGTVTVVVGVQLSRVG